jgi:hypothetical protein
MVVRISILIVIILFYGNLLYSQSISVPISPKHLKKIEKANLASGKLKRYSKFYSRDSASFMKKYQAVLKQQADSLFLVTRILLSKSENKLIGKAAGDYSKITSRDYKALVDKYGSKQAREIKEEYSRYSADLKKYEQKFGKFKQLDSLRSLTWADATALVEKEMKSRLTPIANQGEIGRYQKEAEAMKQQQLRYTNQVKQLGDSAYLKQQAKEQAEKLAQEYLLSNPAIAKAAQAKMNALMKVYSSVPNSNDLSTAVKRTSLEGRKFKERLVIGGNFQLIAIRPLTIDLLPLVGYKFNSRFAMGVGGAYRFCTQDSVGGLASKSFGFKAFGSYDVLSRIFLYTEYNRNTIGRESAENGSNLIWQNSWLLGAGKKVSVHRKLDMTVVLVYNFFHKPNDPLYPKPLTLRVGFQLSDVALVKRKAN